MKKSFLLVLGLFMCLFACLAACDNSTDFEESISENSSSKQSESIYNKGTLTLVDSTGKGLQNCKYESKISKETYATRAGNSDLSVWEYMLYVLYYKADYEVTFTEIGGIHPRVYRGYVRTKNTEVVLKYVHTSVARLLSQPESTLYFDLVVWPFNTMFQLKDWNHKTMYTMDIATDGPILAALGIPHVKRNIEMVLLPNAINELLIPSLKDRQKYGAMTVYDEFGKPVISNNGGR